MCTTGAAAGKRDVGWPCTRRFTSDHYIPGVKIYGFDGFDNEESMVRKLVRSGALPVCYVRYGPGVEAVSDQQPAACCHPTVGSCTTSGCHDTQQPCMAPGHLKVRHLT
jgi:hypothetical protein